MAKQWAVAPFQIGDKLPDYKRCRTTVLYNERPVIDGYVDSPQGESGVQF